MMILAAVTLGAWSLSSPAGSSPDEDFHAASIWCGWGTDGSNCEAVAGANERSLPFDPGAIACYAFDPALSADCQPEFADRDERTTVARGNFQGLYPPVYYGVMRAFVGDDFDNSVLRMRLFTSLLTVAVVGLLALLVPAYLRRPLVWGLVCSSVPLGLFILGSINPSGWAVLSAGTLWISYYAAFEATGWRRNGLLALTVLTAAMGAGSRGDACLYSCLAIVVVYVLRWGVLRARWGITSVGAAMIALAAVFFLSSSQATDAAGGIPAAADQLSTVSTLELTVQNALNLPYLITGVFGSWGLGWLDTPMPPLVFQASLATVIGLGFLGLSRAWTRKTIAVLLVAGALFAFPLLVLVQSKQVVGQAVQPRYLLPLVVMLIGVSLLSTAGGPDRSFRLSSLQRYALVAALAVAQSVALHTNIRRYVTGSDVVEFNLDAGKEWWWDVPLSPMAVWLLGTIAFAGLVLLVLRMGPSVDEEAAAPVRPHRRRGARRASDSVTPGVEHEPSADETMSTTPTAGGEGHVGRAAGVYDRP